MRKLAMEDLDRLAIEDFKQTEKKSLVIVLDNVRSLNNVGSVFRTADAFLIQKIYLCGITGTPPHREIQKTALGATDSVDWEYAEDTLTLIQQLKEEQWTILAVEQADESVLLHDFEYNKNQKYVMVFGNEVFGVAEEVVNEAHHCLEIPQFGTKHSLNISVSIGVLVWDYFLKTQRM
jgi:23S rRNA (guanosine2251-2'-O)-methyltransferase